MPAGTRAAGAPVRRFAFGEHATFDGATLDADGGRRRARGGHGDGGVDAHGECAAGGRTAAHDITGCGGRDGRRTQEIAANAPEPAPARVANEVKKSAVGEIVAREAIMDSAARLNANVAGAGVAAQSSAREVDALKRTESERALAGARLTVTEPSVASAAVASAPAAKAPATPALAPAAKAAVDLRERRADQAAEATVAGRAAVGAITGGAAPRDAAVLKAAASADVAVPPLLEGCWMAATAGKPDTTLREPRIARQAGDTLVLVVAADGRTATVRRVGRRPAARRDAVRHRDRGGVRGHARSPAPADRPAVRPRRGSVSARAARRPPARWRPWCASSA